MFRKQRVCIGTKLEVGPTFALLAALMFSFRPLLADVPIAAAPSAPIEENHKVEDVVAAFDALTDRGEWLGFRRGAGAPAHPGPYADPTAPIPVHSEMHFQGIARSPRVGISPILYATRTGCPDCEEPFKSEGTLLVVEMGSRDKDGERLRSNRLDRANETQDTLPDARDKVIKVIKFDSGRIDYYHPGGLQMVGDILAVPLEGKNHPDLPEGKVVFFDASTPTEPKLLNYELSLQHKVGVVGLTKLDDGRHFMVVAWGNGEELEFYRSNQTSFFDTNGNQDPDFEFTLHSTIGKSELSVLEENDYWRFGKTSPQSLNFVNEEGGKLFLIGSSNSCWAAPLHLCGAAGTDDIWLWEVEGFAPGEQVSLLGQRKDSKLLYSDGNLVGDVTFARQEANFNASGAAYVSPTGELLYYSTEYYFWSKYGHIHCGWSGSICDDPAENFLRFVELHHNKVSHTGTCGLQFPHSLSGPYDINEGDTLTLDFGIYYVEPWVHMFEDRDFVGKCNLSLPATEAYHCSTVMMDYADQNKDKYDDFEKLDGPSLPKNGFNDQLSSFRWCGPQDATLYIYDDDSYDPGGSTGYVECAGKGYVVEENDLDDNQAADGCYYSAGVDEFDDEATSAQIIWNPSPMHAVQVDWGEGVPETFSIPRGESHFSVSHLYVDDNPSGTPSDVYTITITDAEGGSSEISTTVTVHNVAPNPSIDSVTDATTGLEIGPGLPLPVALVWLEVNVAGSFTDPGTADTHTATMDWGDGTSDDLGDVVNAVGAAHVYTTPGEYTIALAVTDDDGGVGTATAQIKVVDGAGAIQEVTNDLEALLAQPDLGEDAREAIEDALDKLRGNNGGQADNGALDKLEQGDPNAALEKIKHALQDMAVAETADPNLDLTYCKSLLTLAAKSLALEAIAQATAVATKPNDLRKIEQANDLVARGDALLAASDYVGGVTKYQEAVREVQGML